MDETRFREMMLAAEVRQLAIQLQRERFVQVQQEMIAASGEDNMAEWLAENPPESFIEEAFQAIAKVREQLEKGGYFKKERPFEKYL